MEQKKRVSVIVTIVLLAAISFFLFAKQKSIDLTPEFTLSGNAISDIITNPQEMSLSLIVFISQWILVVIILLILYIRHLKNNRREMQIARTTSHHLKKTYSETDFDLLYKELNEKEKLSTKAIAMIFNIKKDLALEWGKILEDNELVTIDYPAFSDPIIIIKKPEEEENKKNKDKTKNDKEKNKSNPKKQTEMKTVKKEIKKSLKNTKKEIKKIKREVKKKVKEKKKAQKKAKLMRKKTQKNAKSKKKRGKQ